MDSSDDRFAADLDGFDDDMEGGAGPAEDGGGGDGEPLTDPGVADRLLRRYWRLHGDLAGIRRVADAERARVKAWEADRAGGAARTMELLAHYLEGYARARHAETGAKTMSLPHGRLKLTAARRRIVVDDMDALVEALVDAGADDYLRRRVEPDLRTLHAAATTPAGRLVLGDGTVLPGVHAEKPDEPTFAVKPADQDQEDGQ